MAKKQKTLPNMPEASGAGKIAQEFVNLRRDLGEIQGKLEKVGEELMLKMKSENRLSIVVEDGEGTKYILERKKSTERVSCRKETTVKKEEDE